MTLEAKNLSFSYPHKKTVLERVNLSLHSGQRLGLSAPSGRGKTTLCRLLAGWERPAGGQVLLEDAPLSKRGFCPVQLLWQHPEEAVDPLLPLEKTLYEAGPIAPEILDGLGIQKSWLERYPAELSGGELQRLCVARALRPELKFLLCDEASAMLDLITQARLWRFLLAQAERQGLGLLIVSHNQALLERLCTHVLSWEDLSGQPDTRS